MIKKYVAFFLLSISLYSVAGAQTVGDVDTSEMTCTALTYDLKLRSKDSATNNEVTALQNFLLDVGLLDSDPTGYFGAATQKAVKTFQKQNNLLASGFVGPVTRKTIKEKSCNQSKSQTTVSTTRSVKEDTYNANYYVGSYSSQNVLQGVKVSTPEWSTPTNNKGTISVSVSNLPSDSAIDHYVVRFECMGVKLPRNGGDLCGTKENLKNLNIGSYSASFPYEWNTTGSKYRAVGVELAAVSSSGEKIGYVTKTTYYSKGTYKVTVNDKVTKESDTMTLNEAYSDCSKIVNQETDATVVCTWNGSVLLSAKPQPKGVYVFTKNSVTAYQDSSITKSNAYTDCLGRVKNEKNADVKCTWNGSAFYSASAQVEKVSGPKKNTMSCKTRGVQGLANGSLACYGIWDYGDEFGNDQDMCNSSDYITGRTGCVVSTSICSSGKAKATKYVKPSSLELSSQDMVTYATNLNTKPAAVKTQIPALWEYTCVESSATNENTSSQISSSYQNYAPATTAFPTSNNAELYVVGVYEASSDHSFCHSNKGKVTVTVKNTGKPIVLAVSAYEPVVWSLQLESGAQLERVIVGGYNPQEVQGISSSIPVNYYTYASKDRVERAKSSTSGMFYDERDPNGTYYHWASEASTCPKSAAVPLENRMMFTGTSNYYLGYSEEDDGYSKWIAKLKSLTGLAPTSFQGGYKETSFVVPKTVSLLPEDSSKVADTTRDIVDLFASFINVGKDFYLGSVTGVQAMSLSCISLERNLHRGDESALTKKLQAFLYQKGFMNEQPTGFYGDKTIEAVKMYQKSKGIPETGMVYEVTRNTLSKEMCQ